MKELKWLLIFLTPFIVVGSCQHLFQSERTVIASPSTKSDVSKSTETSKGQGPAVLTWENLEALDYETGKAPDEIGKYDGKEVSIPGFAVPIEYADIDKVSEFLLVPEPLMCIHVPAPPPNQLVHVRLKSPDLVESYIPLLVSGRLKIVKTKSEYGAAGYELEGLKIAPYEYEEE